MSISTTALRSFSVAQLRSLSFPVVNGLTTVTVLQLYRPLSNHLKVGSERDGGIGSPKKASTRVSGLQYVPTNGSLPLQWDLCMRGGFQVRFLSTTGYRLNSAAQLGEGDKGTLEKEGKIDNGLETSTDTATDKPVPYCKPCPTTTFKDVVAVERNCNAVGHKMLPGPQREPETAAPKTEPLKPKKSVKKKEAKIHNKSNKKAKKTTENIGLYCKNRPNHKFATDEAAQAHCTALGHQISTGPSSIPEFDNDFGDDVDPISCYFSKFPEFDYNPETSYWNEFRRLWAIKKKLEPESFSYHIAVNGFRKYVQKAFDRDIGVSADDMVIWRKVFKAAGIELIPEDPEGCKKFMAHKHINIIDLHEAYRGVGTVTVYDNEDEFRAYSRGTRRKFPKLRDGPPDTLFGWILREFENENRDEGRLRKKYAKFYPMDVTFRSKKKRRETKVD